MTQPGLPASMMPASANEALRQVRELSRRVDQVSAMTATLVQFVTLSSSSGALLVGAGLLQYGTWSITVNAVGDYSVDMTFPQPFSGTPIAMAQTYTTRPDLRPADVNPTPSNTSFTIYVYNATAGSYTYNGCWFAIGPA